jgi:metallo-beta-lactamase class B
MRNANNQRLSLELIVPVLFLAWSWSAARAQLSVEDFPDLEPTDFGYVSQDRRDAFRDTALQRSTKPFKIFDNLYYVGIHWVASYLLVTDEGLILIDSLHEPYIEDGVEHIRELGFDPADIVYVLGSHGHFDHMGGHAYYQRNFGARVGLTAADWKRAQTDVGNTFEMEVADVDMVVQDGDSLTLGDQTMQFYITPGHTEGVLSMEFTVRDADDEYRAVIFGGGGAQGNDYWKNQTVLGNIRRFELLAAQSPPFRVRLPTHPGGPDAASGLRQQMLDRGPADPHPLVDDPRAFTEYLDQAEANVLRALQSR